MIKILLILLSIFSLISCTHKGDIYDSSKHSKKDFSIGNTILMGVGAVGAAMLVDQCYDTNCLGGGSSNSSDYDWDWDWLPGSSQWRCRGIQTGQFAPDSYCEFDTMDDDRWP